MIKDIQHAIAVQRRRVASNKKGIAKAVHRFMKRTGNKELKEQLPALKGLNHEH